MASTSRQGGTEEETITQPPPFTFGTQAITHVPRAWERTACSPRKHHRKGLRVWKREPHAATDALASAQLLIDLDASMSNHAAKRQRVQHMPAVPANARKQTMYAPTMSDAMMPSPRRKSVRRKSTRSPIKSTLQDTWLSPVKSNHRFEKPITGAGEATTLCDREDDGEATRHGSFSPASIEVVGDVSKFDTIDLRGSTMFGEDEIVEQVSDDGGSTVEFENEDLDDGFRVDNEDDDSSESCPEDDTSTARLIDAGNTGVVRVPNTSEDEGTKHVEYANVDDEIITEDLATVALQANVSGLLASSNMSGEAPASLDVATCLLSPSGDVSQLTEPKSASMKEKGAPMLVEEDTLSTVEFEEPLEHTTSPQSVNELAEAPTNDGGTIEQHKKPSPNGAGNPVPDARVQHTTCDRRGSPAQGLSHSMPEEDSIVMEVRQFNEESEDELLRGSPTRQNFHFSPAKPVISPTRAGSPNKARSAPRLSDDTTYLNEFLSRVKAQAAAKSQELIASPDKASTPRRSPRKALGHLDANSNSPSPTKSFNGAESSSTELPLTPAAKALLECTLSPDTPDELSSTATEFGEASTVRRSSRSKLSTALALSNAHNAIPLRRPDGEPIFLQRTEAQKMAMATRANTRKNKGTAKVPKSVLVSLKDKELSPLKQKVTAGNRKGRNVDWDEQLTYFLEEPSDTQKSSKSKKKTMEKDDTTGNKPEKKTVKLARTPRIPKVSQNKASEPTSGVESSSISRPAPIGKASQQVMPKAVDRKDAEKQVKSKRARVNDAPEESISTSKRPAKVHTSSIPAPKRKNVKT